MITEITSDTSNTEELAHDLRVILNIIEDKHGDYTEQHAVELMDGSYKVNNTILSVQL
jgi:hypothetical protein